MARWEKEDIPDADTLYYRVPLGLYVSQKRSMRPGLFRPNGDSMSTDWSRYSEPAQTRAGGPKPANQYGVLALPVAQVRRIDGMSVEHAPLDENRAHTDVHGLIDEEAKKTARRLALAEMNPPWLFVPEE